MVQVKRKDGKKQHNKIKSKKDATINERNIFYLKHIGCKTGVRIAHILG